VDAPELARIHAEALPPGWDAADFRPYITSGENRLCCVACDGHRTAGFVIAQAAGYEAEILTIAVASTARRQGVGRLLMTAAIDWARVEHSVETVYLEVAEGNLIARAFYGLLGFTLFARREHYYQLHRDRPEAALVMKLALQQDARPV
jgi:ribosomal-protein-alanine N-acetyltransferase